MSFATSRELSTQNGLGKIASAVLYRADEIYPHRFLPYFQEGFLSPLLPARATSTCWRWPCSAPRGTSTPLPSMSSTEIEQPKIYTPRRRRDLGTKISETLPRNRLPGGGNPSVQMLRIPASGKKCSSRGRETEACHPKKGFCVPALNDSCGGSRWACLTMAALRRTSITRKWGAFHGGERTCPISLKILDARHAKKKVPRTDTIAVGVQGGNMSHLA